MSDEPVIATLESFLMLRQVRPNVWNGCPNELGQTVRNSFGSSAPDTPQAHNCCNDLSTESTSQQNK